MANRGRPRAPGGATSAADRKREFDRRMRNVDGQVHGEPARTPIQIYLSADAREVLRRHREDAALAGVAPLLDSKLIEALLLAFQSHRSSDSSKAIESAAAATSESSVSPAKDDEVQRLRFLRAKIRRINSALERSNEELDFYNKEFEGELSSQQWADARETLIERHRREASLLLYPIAQRLHLALEQSASDAARMRTVSDEVIDYLCTLLDQLERESY
jgi:hypothetical protein